MKSWKTFKWLTLCLIFLATTANAAPYATIIDQSDLPLDLFKHIEIYDDEAKALSLQEIRQLDNEQWQRLGRAESLAYTKGNLWVRYQFRIGDIDAESWILNFNFGILRAIDAYVYIDSELVKQQKIDYSRALDERKEKYTTITFEFEPRAQSNIDIYTRVNTDTAIFLVWQLTNKTNFIAQELNFTAINFLYFGLILGMAITIYLFTQR